MSFSSIINVLKVENEERKSARTGNTYQHFAARCVLLTDDGEVNTVGVIKSDRIVKELRDKFKPGTYRATFALQVPDWGDDKGDVVCMLTDITAMPPLNRAVPQAPAKAA